MPGAFKAASTCTRHLDGTAEPSSPAGVSAGDYLLYFFYTNSGTEPSTPSTWDVVSDALVWFGGGWGKVWGKFADGDSTDAPAVAFAGSVCDVCILAFTGVDETTPIDAHWNNNDEDETDPYTLSNVTIANDGSVLACASLTIFGSGSNAPDLSSDGYTLRTQSADDCFAVWTGGFDASTDGGVASLDFGAGGATRSANFVIALKPAAGGGGATVPILMHHYKQIMGVN